MGQAFSFANIFGKLWGMNKEVRILILGLMVQVKLQYYIVCKWGSSHDKANNRIQCRDLKV